MSNTGKIWNILLDELSKQPVARAYSQEMAVRYAQRVKNQPQAHRFLAGYPQRVLANFWHRHAFWYLAPAHFVGGLFLNLLGLQVIRHIYRNRLHAKRKVAPSFSELKHNGVTSISGFLDEEAVQQINAFYEANKSLTVSYLPDFSELILYSNLPSIKNRHPENAAVIGILNTLSKRLDYPRLFYDISSRNLKIKPFISILHHKSFVDRDYIPQVDGNDLPHRDVFYPSYKIFVYLNDVDEDNAAFIYYPGTHAVEERSLLDVYKSSLSYYLNEKKANKPVNALANCSGTPQPVSQNGKAGTAVIFNVAGVHNRGSYKRDMFRERLVLLIDFRQNDALYIPRQHRLS